MSTSLLGGSQSIFTRARDYATDTWMIIGVFLALTFAVLLIFSLPISQIIIGFVFIGSCPMNNLIPVYLIVAGILMFIFLVINIIKMFVKNTILWKLIQLVVGLSCLAWFITGNVWTFRDRDIVQHDGPDIPGTYCHYTVYMCAYSTVFVSYGFLLGSACLTYKRSE